MTQKKLTLLFDGGCPLCLREVEYLRSKDTSNNICFVDIDSPNYQSNLYSGITYREAMGRIHAIKNDSGEILKDISVFREAYQLIGLGWIYAPTKWPVLGFIANQLYSVWAKWRLSITGRPSLEQLCKRKELCE